MSGQPALRAVIYVRVSSAQQADKDYDPEGFSIPAQRGACERKAEALSAEVVAEFVDRGESAKTANRPALQSMLARVAEGGVDYVIVHKVDRLARNRADDVAIVMAIRQAGAQLVSASENIDETPSGLLLHGIMSSIAEFYSQNLATEIKKGTTEKAKKGGTPFKAPVGYLNSREWIDGREIRTVEIDPERAPLVKLAFTLYATGQYALSDLAAILEARGLRSRPTRSQPSGSPMGVNRLSTMLKNDYYVGVVRYAGKSYRGRHEPLIDEKAFEEVQGMLSAQRQSGERSWRHHHYLRGSVVCGECGGRLFFSRVRGNGGIYDYFLCRGRQQGVCSQTHHRAEAVEQAVELHYATVQLTRQRRELIRQAVRQQLEGLAELAGKELGRARVELTRLEREERKLLAAHYADRISEALFTEEEARIRRERIAANELVARLDIKHDQLLETLDLALELTEDIHAAYCRAEATERRLFNQAFFERLEVDSEEITGNQLAEPYAQLLANDLIAESLPRATVPHQEATGLSPWAAGQEPENPPEGPFRLLAGVAPGGGRKRTPGNVGGSYVTELVAEEGLEPPTRGL